MDTADRQRLCAGAPITYDLTTGASGPFGLLEWLLLAAVLAPTITWRFFPPKAS